MRTFAGAWPDRAIVQATLAQITWYHNLTLLEEPDTAEVWNWLEHMGTGMILCVTALRMIHWEWGEAFMDVFRAKLGGRAMRESCVPLAPLPEQKRIVAKVDRLMALCDQLEAQLAQSQRDCDALLSVIVNHVGTLSQSSYRK